MADKRAAAPRRIQLPSLHLDRLRADLLRRPGATALLVLVIAAALGTGAFAHQLIAGDHHASAVYERSVERGAFSRNVYKHQNADLDAIRDAEQAQMRSDGIMKGLLIVAVLLLFSIAATQVLRLAAEERRSG
jgi:hypothetical protein